MIKDVQFISIKEIVSRLLRHPLLQSLDLEQATQYTIDFLQMFGMTGFFQDKEEEVHIEDYRGELPCDLLQVVQVKNSKTGVSMRATTDSFKPTDKRERRHSIGYYSYASEETFKTQNRIIFTSFKNGDVTVSYKAIMTDEEGYPMVIDNGTFLKALELYIKQEVFTVLFDCNKISGAVLQNTQQEYCWWAGKLEAEFSTPSISEMEAISRSYTTLIQQTTHFDDGFRHLGNREYLRRH